ncbi:MAG: ABC transporter substrate-binding protein [Armatimonadota bacterium]|nr:ABC transporter substrate-binding protein [Armatimonadota bacterium]MDR7423354.1 ABC transporter substrate-binding protein [Armatimonadota bacterium]MDR7453542.1 ABC transporter substrate-binding protein [Armatimonadota bacterium]MDR7455680.1 ABC transporter substrate-binding protein [Armatimonadota bacterium]MDR7497469.1 ABC transporter substrate-binding protein [Armatimonadota bacterium]
MSARWWLWLVVVALALPAVPAGAAPAGTTLTIGVDQEVVGLDPNLVTAFSSFRRIDFLYNKLVRYNDRLEIEGDLAESWEFPDPRTAIFRLRRGVRFHSGAEMTSEDVKFTLERVLDPATRSPGRSFIDVITAVETPDRYTVRLRLQFPLASLLSGLASANLSIVERAAVQRFGNLQRNVAGTGPYMLAEWVPDNFMRLLRNPNYFRRGLPRIETVIIRVIPDQASLLAGVRTRALDMATINQGAVIVQARREPNLVVLQKPGINLRIFSFNTTRRPYDDARVRYAFAWAIDRQAIVNTAEFGFAAVSGPIPASTPWATPVNRLPSYAPDVARARRLLAEAGYPNGFATRIVTSPTYEGGIAVAQVIQEQLRAIGVTATLDTIEWGTYINRWVARDFDTMIELRGGDPDPDRFLYRTFHSTGAVNNFLFKDAPIDRLLERGRVNLEAAARRPIYAELERALIEAAPAIFLYTPMETQVLQGYVRGFKIIGNGALYFLEEATIER